MSQPPSTIRVKGTTNRYHTSPALHASL